jgi:hypothetical protein
MHAAPQATARRLFDFCAIPCDDALLGELLERVHFSKLPDTGPDRFRRSGHVGDWRTQWSRPERLLFSAAAGDVLEQTGYAPAMPKRARQLRSLLIKYEQAKRFM